MDTPPKKVFIISLDGATFDVLKPFVNMGIMPNLKSIMSSGSFTDLISTIPPITPVAWTSFMTGKKPEKHGVFGFLRYVPHNLKTEFVGSHTINGKTIWQILSEKGKKVVSIHLPMTYPPYEVNGYMVSGFDTPSLKSDFTFPKTFKQEILELIPDYDFNLATGNEYFFDEDFDEFVGKIKRSLEIRYLVADHLLDSADWDVFMLQFQDLDRIQHNIWHYIDVENTYLEKTRIEKTKKIYSYLDQLIGLLYEKIKKIPHYSMVVSDHGFGDAYMAIHPNSLLKEMGLLNVKTKKELNMQSRIRRIYNILQNPIKELKNINSNLLMNDQIAYSSRKIDWKRTKAYVPIADYGGALCYINKKGREPLGIVTDQDYDTLCLQIKNDCENLTEPFSGDKVFSEVIFGKEYFKNNDPGYPDLIMVPNERFTVNNRFAINGVYSKSALPGTHRMNGILIVNGYNIKEGFTEFKADIIDIAPTILSLLDLPIPSDMDGRPILDILKNEKSGTRWEETDDSASEGKGGSSELSDKEKELLESKLKNLGYL